MRELRNSQEQPPIEQLVPKAAVEALHVVRLLAAMPSERLHDLPHCSEQLPVAVYLPGTVPHRHLRIRAAELHLPAVLRLLADAESSADVEHVCPLPKVQVSLPKQAHDPFCTASLLHPENPIKPQSGHEDS